MILPLSLLLCAAASAAPGPKPVAGSVVRSKEWVVRRGKSKEEEFIGDVRYESAGTKLSADWALYRETPNDWRARGHILASKRFEDGGAVETGGETSYYNQTTESGSLEPAPGGRISLLRTTPLREPDHGEGDRLTWEGRRAFTLRGRAKGWGPTAEFWADEASYGAEPARSLALTGGRPLLHVHDDGVDGALNAESVRGAENPRRADAAGHVVGWLIDQSTYSRAGDPPVCVRGSREGRPGPDARVSALLAPPASGARTDAALYAAEDAAFAARACPWGPRVEFWADEARYEELPDRRLTLTGGQAALRKRDDDWSTALKADRFVATGSPRRVLAQGKVRGWIQFKDEKKYERPVK